MYKIFPSSLLQDEALGWFFRSAKRMDSSYLWSSWWSNGGVESCPWGWNQWFFWKFGDGVVFIAQRFKKAISDGKKNVSGFILKFTILQKNWGVFFICKDIHRHSQIGCFTMLWGPAVVSYRTRSLDERLHLWGWRRQVSKGIFQGCDDYSVICLYRCAPLPYGVLQVKNPQDGKNIIHVPLPESSTTCALREHFAKSLCRVHHLLVHRQCFIQLVVIQQNGLVS